MIGDHFRPSIRAQQPQPPPSRPPSPCVGGKSASPPASSRMASFSGSYCASASPTRADPEPCRKRHSAARRRAARLVGARSARLDQSRDLEPVHRVQEVVGLRPDGTSPRERSTGPIGMSKGTIAAEASRNPRAPGKIHCCGRSVAELRPTHFQLHPHLDEQISRAQCLDEAGLASTKGASSVPLAKTVTAT